VPDVRGQSMADAQAALEGAGFTFADGGVIDSELPAGTVARTDPASGSSASNGATITVFSSNGSQTLLPDVTGQSLEQARGTLSGYNITTTDQAINDPTQNNRVIAMTPAAGTPATRGSNVTLVIGKQQGAAG